MLKEGSPVVSEACLACLRLTHQTSWDLYIKGSQKMCLYRGRTVTVDNRVRYVALIALGDRHCVYVFGLSPEPSYSQLSRDLFRPRGKKVMLGEAVAQDVLDGWDIAAVENKFWEEEHKGAVLTQQQASQECGGAHREEGKICQRVRFQGQRTGGKIGCF